MHQIGEYVIRITSTALICSILLSLLKDGPIRKLLRLSCGIYLVLAVMNSLNDVSMSTFDYTSFCFRADSEAVVSLGEDLAAEAREILIKEQLQAYVLDKASSFGASLDAEFHLDKAGFPVSIRLSGTRTPEMQKELSEYLTRELGIAKENQLWTG